MSFASSFLGPMCLSGKSNTTGMRESNLEALHAAEEENVLRLTMELLLLLMGDWTSNARCNVEEEDTMREEAAADRARLSAK